MNDEKIGKGSFLDHFAELRSRLINCFIYLFIIFIISYFFAENIYSFLVHPYAEAVKDDGLNRRMIFFLKVSIPEIALNLVNVCGRINKYFC